MRGDNLKPVLFSIFKLNVYGYGTMMAIAIFVALLLLEYRSKKRNYDEDSILNMSIITIICGILGGKLLYLITEIKNIAQNPDILKNIGAGFVIYGAIIGGALGVFYYSKRKKWNVFKVFDLVIPSVALAQGIGRIGCFLSGCCYGKATTLPWGVEFKNSLYAPSGVLRHPTQIYSSIFDILLAVFLLQYDKKKRKEGRVFALYVIIYSVGRFLVEFLRDDPRGSVGVFSTSQFISIITLVFGVILYNIDKLKKGKNI